MDINCYVSTDKVKETSNPEVIFESTNRLRLIKHTRSRVADYKSTTPIQNMSENNLCKSHKVYYNGTFIEITCTILRDRVCYLSIVSTHNSHYE